ncbi:hypothetical protein H6F86_20545 [Phormidium sp. FACHB-592]|uniref:Uncharacterized protein n=1 Tax=Stenomitos frigidus AS-A4 TaxID=2933935 RepID=A0ABV0KEE9_9CYAN|nr:hypothetical protein [Phormidium sp. FACHB-592]MBD2076222.1 hypothetical protein [Phormidium sp. FACHB-592]
MSDASLNNQKVEYPSYVSGESEYEIDLDKSIREMVERPWAPHLIESLELEDGDDMWLVWLNLADKAEAIAKERGR